eukprot:2277692-Lingulodinium_polyedra.AAC.1
MASAGNVHHRSVIWFPLAGQWRGVWCWFGNARVGHRVFCRPPRSRWASVHVVVFWQRGAVLF